ncbi:MAG: aminoacyl-tRNA hydrolase [Chloroflexi bacterium]|nr:aminoacyl-tRNA hydrolase [Chloroflexota bacterium]
MIIIVGLGNPGERYGSTRHNAGFWCVDALSRKLSIPLDDKRPAVVCGEGYVDGQPVVLAEPRTYMNRSGQAVRYLLDRYRQPPSSLLVVYDDMDLPLGRIRLRPSGSAAGHNGIKSIIAETGTQEFPRVRIGIGHPREGDAIGYVLGGFSGEEAKIMEKTLEAAVEAVLCVLREGLSNAMNQYNQRTITLDS